MKRRNQLGIYEKALNNKWDWEEKILIAKRAGFDFIEMSIDESDSRLSRLDWDKEQVTALLNLLLKHNFAINSICLSAHRRFPLGSEDPLIRARAVEIAQKACILAKRLGVRVIQVAAYDVYYESSNPRTIANFIKGMQTFVRLAKHHQIQLAFETMDTKFAGTISRCINLINKIGTKQLFIYPDLGNLSRFTNDVESELELGRELVVACHFKDTLPGRFKEVDFGLGDVDFLTPVSKLLRGGFVGPFLIEMWSKNDPEETQRDNLKSISQAREFFDRIYSGALEEIKSRR